MVPTGAGIFSPHFLQRMVKSHCRLSGRLNTNVSIGEQKTKVQDCKSLEQFWRNPSVIKCHRFNRLIRDQRGECCINICVLAV